MNSDVGFDSVTYTKKTVEESITLKIKDQSLPLSTTPSPILTPANSTQRSGSPHFVSPPTQCHGRPPLHADSTLPVTTVPYDSSVPHPDELRPPSGVKIQGYYVVTIGQEVGIFFHWYVFYVSISTFSHCLKTKA
jgi:hypothetical protein